jgi:HPt (histidine-containing phosphotransfer) domain-containing protein
MPACDNELSRALAEIPGLDVIPAMRTSAEQLVSYVALLNRFLAQHSQDMPQLRKHLAAGERDAAHGIAHKLKGIAGLIGARRILSLASEIAQELLADANDSIIEHLAHECEAELARLIEAARNLPAVTADLPVAQSGDSALTARRPGSVKLR